MLKWMNKGPLLYRMCCTPEIETCFECRQSHFQYLWPSGKAWPTLVGTLESCCKPVQPLSERERPMLCFSMTHLPAPCGPKISTFLTNCYWKGGTEDQQFINVVTLGYGWLFKVHKTAQFQRDPLVLQLKNVLYSSQSISHFSKKKHLGIYQSNNWYTAAQSNLVASLFVHKLNSCFIERTFILSCILLLSSLSLLLLFHWSL